MFTVILWRALENLTGRRKVETPPTARPEAVPQSLGRRPGAGQGRRLPERDSVIRSQGCADVKAITPALAAAPAACVCRKRCVFVLPAVKLVAGQVCTPPKVNPFFFKDVTEWGKGVASLLRRVELGFFSSKK